MKDLFNPLAELTSVPEIKLNQKSKDNRLYKNRNYPNLKKATEEKTRHHQNLKKTEKSRRVGFVRISTG